MHPLQVLVVQAEEKVALKQVNLMIQLQQEQAFQVKVILEVLAILQILLLIGGVLEAAEAAQVRLVLIVDPLLPPHYQFPLLVMVVLG
jgi:hypothetical protein